MTGRSSIPDLIALAGKRVQDFALLRENGLIPLSGTFFPSVHYPPITMYGRTTPEELFKGYTLPSDGLFDIYAHLPFCIRQCVFCHYPVMTGERPAEKDEYLDGLEREMDLAMDMLGVKKLKARSILVGGGTPTYLSPAQLERFLSFFTDRLDIPDGLQFSYDVDPSTLLGKDGEERLRIMKRFGVNRLTIGLQSLHDDILKLMNRAHTAEEAERSVIAAREQGFEVNVELIYGYEGQSMELWAEDVQRTIALSPDEIQLYRLKILAYGDYQGYIKKEFSLRPERFPGSQEAVTMKQLAILLLGENGYKENLRRVFSRDPKVYSHYADNQCCGLYDELGFGLTAFSSLRDRFGLNTDSFEDYYSLLKSGRLPLNRGLVRDKSDQLRWCLILPLKNRVVHKKYYEKLTGVSLDRIFRPKIERLRSFGLLKEDERTLSLTELGSFFADEVCEQFSAPRYLPFPREEYAEGPLNPYLDPEP